MDKPTYVYVTYIKTTAEKVWRADAAIVDVVGTVVESDRPRRLVVTWADPKEARNPAKVSRVTYDIAEDGDMVCLTVTHVDLDAEMLRGISQGWPVVLSGLKTLLETGKPLPPIWGRDGGRWKKLRFEARAQPA